MGGDASNFLFNAKNQITLWGPHGEINDYSTRQWNGVVGDYQYVRWTEYLKTVAKCVFANATLDLGDYHERMMKFGLAWAYDDAKQYIEKAEGDFLEVGQYLLEHYFHRSGEFAYHSDMTGAPEGVYFTSVSRDVEVLSVLCLQDPWCEGFNSKGELFHGLEMKREKGTSLYLPHSPVSSTNTPLHKGLRVVHTLQVQPHQEVLHTPRVLRLLHLHHRVQVWLALQLRQPHAQQVVVDGVLLVHAALHRLDLLAHRRRHQLLHDLEQQNEVQQDLLLAAQLRLTPAPRAHQHHAVAVVREHRHLLVLQNRHVRQVRVLERRQPHARDLRQRLQHQELVLQRQRAAQLKERVLRRVQRQRSLQRVELLRRGQQHAQLRVKKLWWGRKDIMPKAVVVPVSSWHIDRCR